MGAGQEILNAYESSIKLSLLDEIEAEVDKVYFTGHSADFYHGRDVMKRVYSDIIRKKREELK